MYDQQYPTTTNPLRTPTQRPRATHIDTRSNLQHKFNAINQQFMNRTHQSSTLSSQLSNHKDTIHRIQVNFQKLVNRLNEQTTFAKNKLEYITLQSHNKYHQLRNKQTKNTHKLLTLKTEIELEVNTQRYIADLTLQEITSQHQKTMKEIQRIKRTNSHTKLISQGEILLQKITQQTTEVKNRFQEIKNKTQAGLDETVSSFEDKITLWKQRQANSQADHDKLLKKLLTQIESVKADMIREMEQERMIRQENKQKLLALFELNCQTLPCVSKLDYKS